MANDTLTQIVTGPQKLFNESFSVIINSLPQVITSIIILFIGWFIAKISETIVENLLKASQVDKWLKDRKLKESLYGISITRTGSLIVKYYILIIFLKEATYRAGLIFLADMFDSLINAVPDLTIGSTIIVMALVFADILKKRIKQSVFPFNDTFSELAYGIIIFFALVMALPKFGLTNTKLIEDSFRYIVIGISLGLSIAIGIGFGWAIKEGPAKEFFKKRR